MFPGSPVPCMGFLEIVKLSRTSLSMNIEKIESHDTFTDNILTTGGHYMTCNAKTPFDVITVPGLVSRYTEAREGILGDRLCPGAPIPTLSVPEASAATSRQARAASRASRLVYSEMKELGTRATEVAHARSARAMRCLEDMQDARSGMDLASGIARHAWRGALEEMAVAQACMTSMYRMAFGIAAMPAVSSRRSA